MIGVFRAIRRFLRQKKGASGVEYALLTGLIASAFVVGSGGLGSSLNTFYSNASNCISAPGIANCSRPFANGNGGNGNGNGKGHGKGNGKG